MLGGEIEGEEWSSKDSGQGRNTSPMLSLSRGWWDAKEPRRAWVAAGSVIARITKRLLVQDLQCFFLP